MCKTSKLLWIQLFETMSRQMSDRRRGKNWITFETILGPPGTQTGIALELFHDGQRVGGGARIGSLLCQFLVRRAHKVG